MFLRVLRIILVKNSLLNTIFRMYNFFSGDVPCDKIYIVSHGFDFSPNMELFFSLNSSTCGELQTLARFFVAITDVVAM